MADYNLWADLLDTFQSSSDYIKTVILIVPPVFVLVVFALSVWWRSQVLRYRSRTQVLLPQALDDWTEQFERQRGASRFLDGKSGLSDQGGHALNARSIGSDEGRLR